MRASARLEVSPTPSSFCCGRDRRRENSAALFCGGLEPLVAVAPEFRPGRSLFSLAGGFRFFPFRCTFLLAFARGELAGARLCFCFGSLLGCARLLRERGRRVWRQRSREQSGGEEGDKHNFVHDVYFPLDGFQARTGPSVSIPQPSLTIPAGV